ncbi:MAG: hypothetical protein AVDCRST_MAG89-3251 [uncultured Gemmatimonadetes bacterium]|uniref:Uncharacterized protein n=1 Tax=uncultured Gemmatimonadota bacterium TaxID=203437 RepID=A0A6J4M972_9BACT|nr:MAG: hypothetical protein AVDCRST_MAG89-3251 [uncultured Gemmatimonadota bacterium]
MSGRRKPRHDAAVAPPFGASPARAPEVPETRDVIPMERPR